MLIDHGCILRSITRDLHEGSDLWISVMDLWSFLVLINTDTEMSNVRSVYPAGASWEHSVSRLTSRNRTCPRVHALTLPTSIFITLERGL